MLSCVTLSAFPPVPILIRPFFSYVCSSVGSPSANHSSKSTVFSWNYTGCPVKNGFDIFFLKISSLSHLILYLLLTLLFYSNFNPCRKDNSNIFLKSILQEPLFFISFEFRAKVYRRKRENIFGRSCNFVRSRKILLSPIFSLTIIESFKSKEIFKILCVLFNVSVKKKKLL